MIGPIETYILISVFVGKGAVEGLTFKTETKCLEHKYYLMELWENDEVDQFVYMMECRNDNHNT